jgi:hypothetical protein
MTFVNVHRLRKANVGANSRAHKVEDPEAWQDPSIELAVSLSVHAFVAEALCALTHIPSQSCRC